MKTLLEPPLVFVDLDGTLLAGDLFLERLVRVVLLRPWWLWQFLLTRPWEISHLKRFLAERMPVDASHLPYRSELLERLRQEHRLGARLVLATAADEADARAVADHLGIFEFFLGTRPGLNLKGAAKLRAIERCADGSPFTYVGDSPADLPVWRQAESIWLVHGTSTLQRACAALGKPLRAISPRPAVWAAGIRALRPHQWAKNLLVLLPAATSLGMYSPARLWDLWPALVVLCLLSSAVYLLNDLSDIAADRQHPHKRRRPLASGALTVVSAVALIPLLLGLAIVLAVGMLPTGHGLLLAYLVLALFYNGVCKELPHADVLALAALYLLRVVLGAEVLQVPYSDWFLLFLGLTFLNLAWLKRYIEVREAWDGLNARRRGYQAGDGTFLLGCGLASLFTALVVLALFTQSSAVATYRGPHRLLWLGLPYLYYSLHLWHQAGHGRIHHDPVRHVLTDGRAYLAGAAGLAVLIWARLVR